MTISTLLQSHAAVTAIGTYVPDRILSNSDLEKLVDTSDEWIFQRTGIRERRIAQEQQYASDLAIEAVRDLIHRYNKTVHDVDYIIVATSTPDAFVPSVASRVQASFGMKGCGNADLQAACAGFTSALQMANGLLLSKLCRKILIIGTETLSRATDYTDRTTCILFGDGAGAMLVETLEMGADLSSASTAGSTLPAGDILASNASTDGEQGHHVYRSSLAPHIGSFELSQNNMLVQNGREVYRWALSRVAAGVQELLDGSGHTAQTIDWFVPHNANQRIIDALCERIGFEEQQALSSIEHYGNTSAASIPLALDAAVKDGRVKPGHLLLLYGFGGGLTQSGVIMRWSI
ncbi:ketoacyl-ACP synthase III [Paenibacillus sp. Leaf72]|uniref:ketoacyl-ACP synthase III n=1 Tax=Paenibacillus sp. Leaf72 TaxID=1736234 RepID=UPI0006FA890B|nr:ketoacyl-ACP synthase III [Paenibacillus sp. Leaf72]KQO17986.1 3-oxoacyl-ACP synthase [Paenibacillus sp. Leaf72]